MTAEEIREIRTKKLLLTTREFAEALGVTQATVSAWETGKCEISIRNQRKVKQLVEGKNERFNNIYNTN